ncbi:hypothetical protein IV203_001999 [Nitzschia inconspicua]|uniref:Uncharacterized protein n=1 Tax=Nitzschia inconspicua TaxID=303405 RepID=A0A9K3PS19_9STRA|nr:hypothetical protein IV203_001999 [Nitzschia inconspicua]
MIAPDGTVSVPNVESALDWYQRCKRRSRRHHNNESLDLPWWAEGYTVNGEAAAAAAAAAGGGGAVNKNMLNPALRFLWGATSGIAPIDAAWKQAIASSVKRLLSMDTVVDPLTVPPPPPPAILLEGPSGCGKTWMLLTLAARFLVATRPSAWKEQSVETECKHTATDFDAQNRTASLSHSSMMLPEVIFMDSNFDFCISKMACIIRCTLLREYDRIAKKDGNTFASASSTTVTMDLDVDGEEEQRLMHRVEQDLEECLSRVHIVQVDYGSTNWVPVLEVLRHQLALRKVHGLNSQQQEGMLSDSMAPSFTDSFMKPNDTPTLLLWDGFLEDIVGRNEEINRREVFLQMSRLLQQECQSLWWVLSARGSTTATKHTGANIKGGLGNESWSGCTSGSTNTQQRMYCRERRSGYN